jgi:hypothetical protein
MATNINNNSRVVNVGRTTPVSPGQQPAARSIPVVLASDQPAIPVEEQNKVQSEVSLSLLGIPRSEVALGIFADVNTYDVNPSEWSSFPQFYTNGHGIRHLPNEAGALVEAPRNQKAILTSKRFFRYQPGRVSAATFGVKATISTDDFALNPVIRKYGIFDNFDGYYWEHRQSGKGDNFSVVRRTQSLLNFPVSPFGNIGQEVRKNPTVADEVVITRQQTDDYRTCGKGWTIPTTQTFSREREILIDSKWEIAEESFAFVLSSNTAFEQYYTSLGDPQLPANDETFDQFVFRNKCHRDVSFWIDMYTMDLEWGGDAHTKLNTKNYRTALLPTPGREIELHTAVKSLILNKFTIGSSVYTKLDTLTDIPLTMFGAAQPQSAWTSICSSVNWGNKERLDTVFDSRKIYWAYFVSSYEIGNVDDGSYSNTNVHSTANATPYYFNPIAVTYDLGNVVGQNITPAYPLIAGQAFGANPELSIEQAFVLNAFYDKIKNKCVRDVQFVIDGYKNDIVGGGNMHTKYNMSMFYEGGGQSVYSQFVGGLASERSRHTHLRDMIIDDLKEAPYNMSAGDVVETKLIDLSTDLVNNFNIESQVAVENGQRGFPGNLIAFRDGLPMIHAAVNDPALLNPEKKVRAYTQIPYVPGTNNNIANWAPDPGKLVYGTQFRLAEGTVQLGQKVRLYTETGNAYPIYAFPTGESVGGWISGDIFTVREVIGTKGDTFTLNGPDGLIVSAVSDSGVDTTPETNSLNENWVYIDTTVPFITPQKYDPEYYRLPSRDDFTITRFNGSNVTTTYDEESDPFIKGMQWPLKYSSNIQLNDAEAVFIGDIDTTLDPNDNGDLEIIRQQYDTINFTTEYINWVRCNVKPEFWGVYEYRIPRSRFSHDKLDAEVSKRVYSDVATSPTGIVRPGMNVLDEDGIWQDAESLYSYDFTKVTMLKIEFSWYGAVGALFLAYVPVGNGEARWVRVHHLRASNQLKIASLGNATLPITYNVWGGGTRQTYGDVEYESDSYNYGNPSHHIVKYGASYYIDGGDRGTVRLYSHNNISPIDAIGKQWVISEINAPTAGVYTITETQTTDGINLPAENVFFMGATLKTNDPRDAGIKVKWVDGNDIEFTRQPAGGGITLITDRAPVTYGLETKETIFSTAEGNPVRNRVQVYPTKLSTANLGDNPVRLRMKKTPIFQTQAEVSGSLELTQDYTITAANLPLPTNETNAPYILNNEELYGWFKGSVLGNDVTIFGRLYKVANEYFFESFESYTDTITLLAGEFLADQRFAFTSNNGVTEVTNYGISDTRTILPATDTLSSINVTNDPVVPIPGTGINIATVYLTSGSEQLELNTYFDYNKEYLSYPLTDEAETLYFAIDSDTSVGSTPDPIAIGITWEEQ